MKKSYRKFKKGIHLLVLKLHLYKTWIFEWVNIFKKRKLYRKVRLVQKENNQIQDLWEENYGRKISTKWHRLYQSYTGEFDRRYIPEIIFTTKLEPLLNPRSICKVYSDKSLLEVFYKGDKDVIFPKTNIVNCSGILYDGSRKIISESRAIDLLQNAGDTVLKITMGESSGRGIVMCHFKNGTEVNTGRSIKDILSEYRENFIVQDRILTNENFSKLYDKSINTMRVITYVLEDKIFHAPLTLRIGTGGKEVDNIHAGGIAIGMSDDGELKRVAYTEFQQRYERHPDSNVIFEGHVIPYTQKIIKAAKRLHEKTTHLKMISWDFTVDKDNNVVLLEINVMAQSVWFPQMVNGKSFFGENTEKMLQLISR